MNRKRDKVHVIPAPLLVESTVMGLDSLQASCQPSSTLGLPIKSSKEIGTSSRDCSAPRSKSKLFMRKSQRSSKTPRRAAGNSASINEDAHKFVTLEDKLKEMQEKKTTQTENPHLTANITQSTLKRPSDIEMKQVFSSYIPSLNQLNPRLHPHNDGIARRMSNTSVNKKTPFVANGRGRPEYDHPHRRDFASLEKVMDGLTKSRVSNLINTISKYNNEPTVDCQSSAQVSIHEQDTSKSSKSRFQDTNQKTETAVKLAKGLLESKLNNKRANNNSAKTDDATEPKKQAATDTGKMTPKALQVVSPKRSIFTTTIISRKLSKRNSQASVEGGQSGRGSLTPSKRPVAEITGGLIPLADGIRQLGSGIPTNKFSAYANQKNHSLQVHSPAHEKVGGSPQNDNVAKSPQSSVDGTRYKKSLGKEVHYVKPPLKSPQKPQPNGPSFRAPRVKDPEPMSDNTFIRGIPRQPVDTNYGDGSSILLNDESTLEGSKGKRSGLFDRKGSDEELLKYL